MALNQYCILFPKKSVYYSIQLVYSPSKKVHYHNIIVIFVQLSLICTHAHTCISVEWRLGMRRIAAAWRLGMRLHTCISAAWRLGMRLHTCIAAAWRLGMRLHTCIAAAWRLGMRLHTCIAAAWRLGMRHEAIHTHTLTHSLNVDGWEHVLQHGCHQLARLLLRGEVIQHQLEGTPQ